jgi:hypothetical protein
MLFRVLTLFSRRQLDLFDVQDVPSPQLNQSKRNIFLEKFGKYDKIRLINNPVKTKP